MHLKHLLITLILPLAITTSMADQGEEVQIKRNIRYTSLPKQSLADKKIHVAFNGSPKMAASIAERLRARGFTVVDAADDADEKIRLDGMFKVSGAGKEEIRGTLGELLEKSVADPGKLSPDYKHQNVDLIQIGASLAYTGFASAISVTDMVRWLGQKTGVAGRFNELVAGDPRGFCFGETCTKHTSFALMSIKTSSGHWWGEASITDNRVMLNLVIGDLVDAMLKPIYDNGPAQGVLTK